MGPTWRVEQSRAKKLRPHKKDTMCPPKLPLSLNSFPIPELFHCKPTFSLYGLRKFPFLAMKAGRAIVKN